MVRLPSRLGKDRDGTPVRRAVVTGATGFIGCHLVAAASAVRGIDVLAIDNLRIGRNFVDGDPAVSFVRADFESDEAHIAIAAFAPDVVVHLAALHYLPYCRLIPTRPSA